MSLNWDISKIDERTTRHENGDMKVTTENLIMMTMAVDMGEIKESNWKEFYVRISIWEKLFGPSVRQLDDEGEMVPVFTTAEDVHNHVGLHTNVSYKTDAGWRKRVFSNYESETIRGLD